MAFVDRLVEHPGRVTLTDVSNGTELGTFDMVRAEGEVEEEGTPLNAENLNAEIGGAINSAVGGFRVSEIQCGAIKITPTAAKAVTTATVTFPAAFQKVPRIIVQPTGTTNASPATTNALPTDITTTGFKIKMYRADKVATWVHWIAMTN